jgi:hypothetical protein
MKKLFKIFSGLIAALITLSIFAGLAYYVSDEGSTMGYIATGLFLLMGILGTFVAFAWIAMEDKTQGSISQQKGKDQIDPVSMGLAMSIGMSDNSDDNADSSLSDDSFDSDIDFD